MRPVLLGSPSTVVTRQFIRLPVKGHSYVQLVGTQLLRISGDTVTWNQWGHSYLELVGTQLLGISGTQLLRISGDTVTWK